MAVADFVVVGNAVDDVAGEEIGGASRVLQGGSSCSRGDNLPVWDQTHQRSTDRLFVQP